MLVLHAAWDRARPSLWVWGETDEARSAESRWPAHPFAASMEQLGQCWASLAHMGQADTGNVNLPAGRGPGGKWSPTSSTPMLNLASVEPSALRTWRVPVLAVGAKDILELFADPVGPDAIESDDFAAWRLAVRWALDILAGGRYVPTAHYSGPDPVAVWRPWLNNPTDEERLARLAAALPPAARAATAVPSTPKKTAIKITSTRRARNTSAATPSPLDPGPEFLLTDFVDAIVDATLRKRLPGMRFFKAATRGDRLGSRWLWSLGAREPALRCTVDEAHLLQDWARPRRVDQGGAHLSLRLDLPEATDDWTLHYLLQSREDASLSWPASVVWDTRAARRQRLPEDAQETLLAGLGLASRLFTPIEPSLDTAAPAQAELSTEAALRFIQEGAPALQQAGISTLIPAFTSTLSLKARVRPSSTTTTGRTSAGLTASSVLHFDWQVALGDQALSTDEFARLAAAKTGLVQVRGQWVLVSPEQLARARAFLTRQAGRALSLGEALPILLDGAAAVGLPVAEVEAEGWVQDWLQHLNGSATLTPLDPPPGLTATLRPYQQLGYSWLDFLRRCGLGACLADDMGLGKTLQTLALLVKLKHEGRSGPHLIVCPTSVVANWAREAQRFAPELNVLVHHGFDRERQDLEGRVRHHDLVLTSYALLVRDAEALGAVAWDCLILDEAQNIKNAGTRQAQAARALRADQRIALTGTPIENRLSELWSLFQFLQPGYLGSADGFQRAFAKPIERDHAPEAQDRLRRLIAPFILRRLKTDPKVIDDLPPKQQMKVYCPLTREQATLYQAVVADSLRQIEAADGIQRRGAILAAMLRLKQVCNHPAHYLADGSSLPERSGKLERLIDMLEEVQAAGERALVFTQFAEMGTLLQAHLRLRLGADVLFLHGGTPAAQRAHLVERFQDPRPGPLAFVLSLKAGGTGLNLTAASHVFHFDRWWNPAVENQATDRAFRIGQTRRVQVHTFICAGTVEDQIDALIESKLGLAQSIVGASESWITELSTAQLRELMALRSDAVSED